MTETAVPSPAEVADVAETAETTEVAKTVETAETAEVAKTVESTDVAKTAETAEVAKTVETAEVAEVAKTAETTGVAKTVETTEVAKVVVETPAPAPAVVKAPPKFRGEKPIQTVGRRKEAIVRVRLMPGTGKITCNGRELEQYFPSKVAQQAVREPFVTADKGEVLNVVANIRGGGITGQAGALRLAIARALCELDGDDRPALKKAGFLTRDPRVKES